MQRVEARFRHDNGQKEPDLVHGATNDDRYRQQDWDPQFGRLGQSAAERLDLAQVIYLVVKEGIHCIGK